MDLALPFPPACAVRPNRVKHKPLKLCLIYGCTPLLFRLMVEKHYRSLVKAVSWRFTGSLDTMIIALVVTGKIKWALSISGIELFTKIFLYYVHERVWMKILLGRVQEPRDKPNFEI